MTSDGKGNISYAYQAEGKDVTLTYTKDAYYLCSGNSQCLKYPISASSGSGFDPSSYQFDSSRIDSLKSSSKYKGQETCPGKSGSTCDVWTASSANGGVISTIYVDSSTKRVARVISVAGTTSSDVTYDYKNATVVVPTNAQEIPTP